MHQRIQKAKKQRAEKNDEVIYLGTQPQHHRDKFKRKAKNRLKKEAKDEIIYIGTRPRNPTDRFGDRAKDKKWHKY